MPPPPRPTTCFVSFWPIGLAAIALVLAPFDARWSPTGDLAAGLIQGPQSDLIGWLVSALITIAVPMLGGIAVGALVGLVARRWTGPGVRGWLPFTLGAVASVPVGFAVLVASVLTFSAVPPPATFGDLTYAALVWTAYAGTGLGTTRLLHRAPIVAV